MYRPFLFRLSASPRKRLNENDIAQTQVLELDSFVGTGRADCNAMM
jgi:hypothetical protein